MVPLKGRVAESALLRIYTILVIAAVLTVLAVAKDICIPIALAALLTFLLAPLVTRVERWLGRIAAVVVVLILVSIGTVGVGYVLSQQLLDLTAKLPEYKTRIHQKLATFQASTAGHYSHLTRAIEAVRGDLPEATTPTGRDRDSATATPAPVKVTVVNASDSLSTSAQSMLGPIMSAFALAGLVILLAVFMLLHREDVRGRIIRLAGQGRIILATTAMADAGTRVFRYLVMQSLVNAGFGLAVAIGLYVIGVPNAPLWGALAATLRFIPYVGAWIAAILPIALSLAVSDGWTMVLLTVSWFLLLELITNNVLEPWLYGASTGVSSLALILAAVFWGWIWGPIGLVLATPLTVCLVVMGRHVPRLTFLSVLLSDDEPLTPHEECYHRLLRADLTEASVLVERYRKTHSLTALYDEVLVPVLISAEADHGLDELDRDRRTALHQGVRDLLDDISAHNLDQAAPPTTDNGTPARDLLSATAPPERVPASPRIICLPVRALRDELAAVMLSHLLRLQGCEAHELTALETASELVAAVALEPPDAVCISVVAPSAMVHARNLCLKLRQRLPRLRIVIGFWGATDSRATLGQAFQQWRDITITTTLADATLALVGTPEPSPEHEKPAVTSRERPNAPRLASSASGA